jgi:hypothetical protein
MKRNGFWIARLAVVFAAAGLLATAANAQQSQSKFVGQFTLPCQATWSGHVLPAGDYTMTVLPVSQSSFIEVRSVKGSERVFVPAWSNGPKTGDKDVLMITAVGNGCVVRALNLAEMDMEIVYKPLGTLDQASLHRGQPERQLAMVVTKH